MPKVPKPKRATERKKKKNSLVSQMTAQGKYFSKSKEKGSEMLHYVFHKTLHNVTVSRFAKINKYIHI